MFDRFSEDARKSLSAARQAAQAFRHDYIGTEHMLLGVIASDGTVAAVALRKLGVDAARVRDEVNEIVKVGNHAETMGQLPFTPRGKRVLGLTLEEAREIGHKHIGTGHLLLGLLREGEGIAAQVLTRLGVTLDKARPAVMEVMRSATEQRDGPPPRTAAASTPLRAVMNAAADDAAKQGNSLVEPEDVLVALLGGDGIAARVLRELGATPDGVRKRIGELRGS